MILYNYRKLLNINILLIIFFILLCMKFNFSFADTSISSSSDDELVCVLPFVPEAEPYIQILKMSSLRNSKVIWATHPLPLDIYKMNSEKNGCTEIILILHGLEIKKDLKVYSYTRLATEEEIAKNNLNVSEKNILYSPYLPVLDITFKKLIDSMKLGEKSDGFRTLRRIRIISCDALNISKLYPSLERLKNEFNVEIDYSKISNFVSLFYQDKVSFPNINSIEESFQFDEKESPYFYTYIQLYSLVLGSYGQSSALRGKYSIQVESISLGIGKLTTKIYIPFELLNDLEVGQEKTIYIPRVGFNMALSILKINPELTSEPFLLIADESDDIGFSVDFGVRATVTRNY